MVHVCVKKITKPPRTTTVRLLGGSLELLPMRWITCARCRRTTSSRTGLWIPTRNSTSDTISAEATIDDRERRTMTLLEDPRRLLDSDCMKSNFDRVHRDKQSRERSSSLEEERTELMTCFDNFHFYCIWCMNERSRHPVAAGAL